MANELQVLKGATFNYSFKPAEIEFDDYAGLVERVEMVADHYDNLVLADADLAEINLAHKELNSFIIGLEESRKAVKREYQKPLKEFEKKVKKVVNKLDKPLQSIKGMRDEITNAQEEARREALIDYIKRKIKDTGIELDDIAIPSSWTNKGVWTEKLNPRVKLKEEIDYQVGKIKEENKKMLADRKVLETFLESKGMEQAGWMRQLEFRDSTEIIQEILEAERERKEAVKAKEEADAKSEENVGSPEPAVKEQTEDAVEKITEFEKPKTEQVQYLTEVIEVTATRDKLELMAQFMIDNEINYKPYSE